MYYFHRTVSDMYYLNYIALEQIYDWNLIKYILFMQTFNKESVYYLNCIVREQ